MGSFFIFSILKANLDTRVSELLALFCIFIDFLINFPRSPVTFTYRFGNDYRESIAQRTNPETPTRHHVQAHHNMTRALPTISDITLLDWLPFRLAPITITKGYC